MRIEETIRLECTDIDFQRKTITLNNPEKNSNLRIFNVSSRLIGMLDALPKKKLRIFGDSTRNSLNGSFQRSRAHDAKKLQNPRLLKKGFEYV